MPVGSGHVRDHVALDVQATSKGPGVMTHYRQDKISHACGVRTGRLSLEALPLLSGDTGTPLLPCLVEQASACPRATASKICHTEAISSCSSRPPCRKHRLCVFPLFSPLHTSLFVLFLRHWKSAEMPDSSNQAYLSIHQEMADLKIVTLVHS